VSSLSRKPLSVPKSPQPSNPRLLALGQIPAQSRKTFDYRKREFMRVNISWNDKQRRLSLRMANGSKMVAPMKRNIIVRVAGETVTREVTFEGRALEMKL
jgi:hypothetical protein